MMSERFIQETVKKHQASSDELQQPFANLERALAQLDEIEEDSDDVNVSEMVIDRHLDTESLVTKDTQSHQEEKFQLTSILTELDEMFTICQECGRSTLKDELITGLCFICHNQKELNNIETQLKQSKDSYLFSQLIERLGELEAQVKSIENKQQELASPNFLTGIIDEINKNIQYDVPSPQNHPFSTTPPPPPPPSSKFISTNFSQSTTKFKDINFYDMTFDELKSISPAQLDSLSLHQRNQYSNRLKELTLLSQMSKKERKAYLDRKAAIRKQNLDRKELVANLNDLTNPLFKKMKEMADKSSIVGRGTLGRIESKTVFIHCHNCNKTNRILEGDEAICEACNFPLSNR
jgi:hypothetical protein